MATKRSVGTLGEADLRGKKVFVRADLNVPLDDAQKITDDTRIRASVPTVKFLLEKGAKVILASHLVSEHPLPSILDPPALSICKVACYFRFFWVLGVDDIWSLVLEGIRIGSYHLCRYE